MVLGRFRRSRVLSGVVALGLAGAVLSTLMILPANAEISSRGPYQGAHGEFSAGDYWLWRGNIAAGETAYASVSGHHVGSGTLAMTLGWVCGGVSYGRVATTTNVFVMYQGNASQMTLAAVNNGSRDCVFTLNVQSGTVSIDSSEVYITFDSTGVISYPSNRPSVPVQPTPVFSGSPCPTPAASGANPCASPPPHDYSDSCTHSQHDCQGTTQIQLYVGDVVSMTTTWTCTASCSSASPPTGTGQSSANNYPAVCLEASMGASCTAKTLTTVQTPTNTESPTGCGGTTGGYHRTWCDSWASSWGPRTTQFTVGTTGWYRLWGYVECGLNAGCYFPGTVTTYWDITTYGSGHASPSPSASPSGSGTATCVSYNPYTGFVLSYPCSGGEGAGAGGGFGGGGGSVGGGSGGNGNGQPGVPYTCDLFTLVNCHSIDGVCGIGPLTGQCKDGINPYYAGNACSFPGLTLDLGEYAAWIGCLIQNVIIAIANVGTYLANAVLDLFIPGPATLGAVNAFVTTIGDTFPFSVVGDVLTSLDGAGGSAGGLPAIPVPGGGTVSFPTAEIASAVGPYRGVMAAGVYLIVSLGTLRWLLAAVGISKGGGGDVG